MRSAGEFFRNLRMKYQLFRCGRLNIGPIPTIQLNRLQPHEGNIVDFLFRSRAFQIPENSATPSH
jgi:hypothetical protein